MASKQTQSYGPPFMEFVNSFGDPYECWQEDGFWPNRIGARLEDIEVWGLEISMYYIGNGGMFAYLEYVSGRTFPEIGRAFGILNCVRSQQVCQKILESFGADFPREDSRRANLASQNRSFIDEAEVGFWDALKADDYDNLAEDYYKSVCVAHALPPFLYADNWPPTDS